MQWAVRSPGILPWPIGPSDFSRDAQIAESKSKTPPLAKPRFSSVANGLDTSRLVDMGNCCQQPSNSIFFVVGLGDQGESRLSCPGSFCA